MENIGARSEEENSPRTPDAQGLCFVNPPDLE